MWLTGAATRHAVGVPISVQVRDEKGVWLADLGDVRDLVPSFPSDVGSALPGIGERESYPLLGHVDPFGETCFNQLQVSTLLAELDHLAATKPNADRKALAGAVRVLVATHMSRPHRYLWFIGD